MGVLEGREEKEKKETEGKEEKKEDRNPCIGKAKKKKENKLKETS